ncbi:MAG: NAD(P)/FAD-dependent oxidoreductase [Eubacteriales bacterium]|nr:NAD(P)/FAD-dependent oxidoreductase [Eubacteriales bacterium]
MKDCIIIGKGPAGLSAALYIRRAGYTPLVIGRDSGALGQSHRIENYFGLDQPISGDELFRRGLVQVERLGIEVLSDEVVSIRETEGFRVSTSSGRIISAHTVLLATGKRRNMPNNFNAAEFLGRGVSQCAQCDGFLMRNRALAVIGSGDHAVAELSHLRTLTNNLSLFTNGATITTDRFPQDLPIITDRITELYTDNLGMLAGIRTEHGDYPIEGAFLAQGVASASDFAIRLGAIMDGDSIKVDRNYQTNVSGLFAAGDCIGGVLQISKAVSDGAIAGLSINEYLRNVPRNSD